MPGLLCRSVPLLIMLIFGTEKGGLSLQNSYFWDVNWIILQG
jgi:hypothetical protein